MQAPNKVFKSELWTPSRLFIYTMRPLFVLQSEICGVNFAPLQKCQSHQRVC